MSSMIKIFRKSSSVEIHYDEEESPSVETVGVQYEEEEKKKMKKMTKMCFHWKNSSTSKRQTKKENNKNI